MVRLPQPGGDPGIWGALLNEFILQTHTADGALKDNIVSAAQIADASIPEICLDPAVQAKLNAAAGVQSVAGRNGIVVLDKTDVNLGNVDNTSDANKPVSTAQQTALNLKAPYASPTFTGSVTVPAPVNPSDATTKTYVDNAVTGATIPDATTLVKGKIQLAGDLAGTAALPTVPGLATKEPTITATTSADYYRGDKTFQTLNKAAVGLSNVDNTSDANKPVSTATQTALNTKESTITAGTTSQYYRGDKSFQTLDKTAVGLANVDNTSDANKPVSTAQATADNLRVLKAGDTMTGDLNIPANRLGVGLTNTASATIETIADASRQGVRVQAAGATDLSYSTFVAGDAQLRYLVSAKGDINWSDGTLGVDTSLTRTAAGELTVNSKLTTTSLKVTGGTLASGKALISDVSGNATWQTVDKTTVGLGNVDNTSDANKPVSTATQTALNLKADATSVGVKTLLINTAGDLPPGTPAGVVVVVKS